MKLLALDCSAGPASVAVCEEGVILASSYVNVRLTHSQTLMPMVKNTLTSAMLGISDIDALAITNGPGSFTGIRIGISALKGLAAPQDKPCVGVSTLLATAYGHLDSDCILCAVMDARCSQVYNALFRIQGGKVTRLCEDRAVMVEEVIKELSALDESIIIAGDGAALFEGFAQGLPNVRIAAEPQKFQNACGAALAAEEALKAGVGLSAEEIRPFYLRLPQAERELKLKKGE